MKKQNSLGSGSNDRRSNPTYAEAQSPFDKGKGMRISQGVDSSSMMKTSLGYD